MASGYLLFLSLLRRQTIQKDLGVSIQVLEQLADGFDLCRLEPLVKLHQAWH